MPLLGGVLTNPNCEFEMNWIPMHTLATWSKSSNLQSEISGREQGSTGPLDEAGRGLTVPNFVCI